jgi:type VI secretion system secreted protein Hcp
MAVDAFIWFEPAISTMMQPKGETKDLKYAATKPNPAFEIKDFSFGVENPTTIGSATGGAGAGKIKFNEFTIKKTSDRASPAFFKNCCAGAHYANVTISMRKAGGDPASAGKEFLQFKFATVFTTKIDWSGPGDEGPEESLTFVYGKLGVLYTEQDSAGKATKSSPAGWDQVQNIDASDFVSTPYS